MQMALEEEIGLSREEATALEVRVNEHGRTVVRTRCHRRGHCDQANRPVLCLLFPIHYMNVDHSDAEREEIRGFCALFRMVENPADSKG